MDDRPQWERDLDTERDEADRHDELMPFKEIVEEIKKLVFHATELEPGSYAHEHFLETGHRLEFGCCSRKRRRLPTAETDAAA